MRYKLYALLCPEDKEIKYIGITKQSLNDRLQDHYYDKENIIKYNWLKAIKPKQAIIFQLAENLTKSEAEIQRIKQMKQGSE